MTKPEDDKTELARIKPRKIPASQAIPGNPEHAKLMAQQKAGKGEDWTKKVDTGLRKPALLGAAILAGFVILFSLWAAAAPMAGASLAPGIITASGQNLRVQHFEGGMIEEILVQEGERVAKDQPLIRLDATAARANRARYAKGMVGLKARAERLQAERDGQAVVKFSPALEEEARMAGVTEHLAEQEREFAKRLDRHKSDERIIDKQIAALEEQVAGLQAQSKAARDQAVVLDDELRAKRKLLKRQLTPKSQYLALKRQRAELEGRMGGALASLGEAASSIARLEEQKQRLSAQRSETAVSQLNDVRTRMAETEELLRNAQNVLDRVIVRAPADGVVVQLNKNTPGSVVGRGEDLAIILPKGGELIVEARLSPQDVDGVRIGQQAQLRFSSLNTRTTPEVPGTVRYISADRQIDPVTREPFYATRLAIADVLPHGLRREQIFPGMPVETYFETGRRTMLQYLLKPLSDSMSRSFREE
ncbi:MAG: HlyD family type I secretion periplasmic adaptor subunit [Pseudomonadota bacterium]